MKYFPSILMLLSGVMFFPLCSIGQNTYYPPKLLVEISSNIQVGAKVEGQTKTYINYQIESSNTSSNVFVNSYSNSYIRDVTYERNRKTNEDYYKSRPQASTFFGGIAKAFSGDFSGLADFGGGLIDHMMTPKYRTYETSTYKTSEQYKTANSSTSTNSLIDKQDLIRKITQEETVDVNSGFIRFSIRIHNTAQKGVRVKSADFVLYFRFADGSREVISFETATAGENEVHWLPAQSYKDFEIRVDDQNINTLFSNYVNSEEIELNLNSLEIELNQSIYFAGELEERYEDEGIRVKYFNGVESKEFYALVGAETPTIEDLIRNYLNESVVEFNPNTDSTTYINEAIRKISFNENLYSDRKVDQLEGQELIDWRKWLVTVYDMNNVIIAFKATDKLKAGYKVAISYFSAKQLLGKNYAPVIFTQKDIHFSADNSFHLDVDLKKGDQLIIENVRLENLYTDKVNYRIQNIEVAAGSVFMNSLIPGNLEAESFLKQQSDYESIHYPDQNPAYSFNFNATTETMRYYWMKPTSVSRETHFTSEDYVYLQWFKGNTTLDAIIGDISEEAQRSFITGLIVRQIYNAHYPELMVNEPNPFGIIQGNANLILDNSSDSPQAMALLNLLSSGSGRAEIADSIKKLTTIIYSVPRDLSATENEWRSFMQPNKYYSFLATSSTPVPNNTSYYCLGIGKHMPRMNAIVDTRSGFHQSPFISNSNWPTMQFGQPFGFEPEKKVSIESLVNATDGAPILLPAYSNYSTLNQESVEIKGNSKLFELVFDVRVIRTK